MESMHTEEATSILYSDKRKITTGKSGHLLKPPELRPVDLRQGMQPCWASGWVHWAPVRLQPSSAALGKTVADTWAHHKNNASYCPAG